MPRIVIYGAGGFGREVARLAKSTARSRPDWTGIVFASDDPRQVGCKIAGLTVIASHQIGPDDLCTIAIAEPAVRRKLASRCPAFLTLIAPMAVVYPEVRVGNGSIIADFASVTADEATHLGVHCLVNTHATIGHDCKVGDFVTIGPSASVNGNVVIEDDAFVGCGARIRNGSPDRPLTIGQGAVIGMGAIVVCDVPPGAVVVGNPARPIAPIAAAGERQRPGHTSDEDRS